MNVPHGSTALLARGLPHGPDSQHPLTHSTEQQLVATTATLTPRPALRCHRGEGRGQHPWPRGRASPRCPPPQRTGDSPPAAGSAPTDGQMENGWMAARSVHTRRGQVGPGCRTWHGSARCLVAGMSQRGHRGRWGRCCVRLWLRAAIRLRSRPSTRPPLSAAGRGERGRRYPDCWAGRLLVRSGHGLRLDVGTGTR